MASGGIVDGLLYVGAIVTSLWLYRNVPGVTGLILAAVLIGLAVYKEW